VQLERKARGHFEFPTFHVNAYDVRFPWAAGVFTHDRVERANFDLDLVRRSGHRFHHFGVLATDAERGKTFVGDGFALVGCVRRKC
jgi:hypothetical protein